MRNSSRSAGSGRFLLTASALLLAVSWPAPAAAQTATNRAFAFDASIKGNDRVQLRWPVALAAAPDGELAVADAFGPRVLFFRDTGVEWTVTGSLDLPAAPTAMIRDGERYILSLRHAPRLLALEGPGHALRNLALPGGSIPGALAALPEGGFLVHDLAGDRLLEVSIRGSVRVKLDVIPAPVSALAATAGGGWVAADPQRGILRRYDPAGQSSGEWPVPAEAPVPAWPAGLALEPGGSVVVSDRHSARLVRLDAGGRAEGVGSRKGWSEGLLRFPGAITWLPDRRLAVVDQGNGRVQLFKLTAGTTGP